MTMEVQVQAPQHPAERRGGPLLVYCAGVPWAAVQGTDKQLAKQLCRHLPVLWIDPPYSLAHAARRRELRQTLGSSRLRTVAPGIARLVTVAPPYPERSGVSIITDALLRKSIRWALRRVGGSVAAMIVTSPKPDFEAVPRTRHVYYATDDFVAGASLMGKSANRVRKAERRLLEAADFVFAVSREITARWSTDQGPFHVLPNGCDPDHYAHSERAAIPPDVHLSSPIAGVVGQLSRRIDISLLEAVAAQDISLLLVGPLQPDFEPGRISRLLARPNVAWVGEKRFEDLPSYLRVIDVGLTPYADSEFNRASFPLKTLEYLSAGRMAVSTPLPALSELRTPFIRTASGADDFVRETRRAIEESGSDMVRDGCRAFAAQHSWQDRASTLLETIGVTTWPFTIPGGR
ncbi:MAG: glycosyltransferase [Nocardioidaceae bacterium]